MDEVVHHKTALRRLGSLSWPQTATRPNWNQADGTLATGRQEGNSSIEPRVPATFVCYWSYPRDHGHDTGRQATGNWITLLLPSPYVRARRHCSEYSSKLYLVTTLGFSLSFFWQPVIIKWELVRYPTQIVGVREPHIPLKWPLWAGQSDAGLLRPIHVRRPCWGRVRAGNVSSPLQHGRKIFLMKKKLWIYMQISARAFWLQKKAFNLSYLTMSYCMLDLKHYPSLLRSNCSPCSPSRKWRPSPKFIIINPIITSVTNSGTPYF